MATVEKNVLLRGKDEAGNDRLMYPITLAENVEGLEEAIIQNAPDGGVPIVTATSTDGVAYTGTLDGITALTAGLTIVFVSSKSSASKTPTLDLNGLGAKNIRRRMSGLSSMVASGYSTNWLFMNKGFLMEYDGAQWIVASMTQPMADDLYGNVPASKISAGTFGGQTNVNATAAATLTNAQVRDIYAGTEDMTAGTSELATGTIYLVYE